MIKLKNIEVDVALSVQGHNGKWASAFEHFRVEGTRAYLMSSVESAPLWFDAAAARVAAHRALETLEQTGKYPNMCEVW